VLQRETQKILPLVFSTGMFLILFQNWAGSAQIINLVFRAFSFHLLVTSQRKYFWHLQGAEDQALSATEHKTGKRRDRTKNTPTDGELSNINLKIICCIPTSLNK